MALLDVNALVALAWDSHVHHLAIRAWFGRNGATGWATCPVTESGFVRLSSNPKVPPSPIGAHRFLVDNVSMVDADVPATSGHRQVTDAHLVTLARREGVRVVTFDAGLAALAGHQDVGLLGFG